ncbi:MAG TPA: hypothetical protein VFD76_04990 [Gemmatimonadales bacterium]|nr:hypothetical protein [Gemmatimonadales bacterium]
MPAKLNRLARTATAVAAATALTVAAATAHAQVASLLIARSGIRTDSPHVGTYHFLELFQTRGDWVFPDLGAVDFSHDTYRELFAGAGRTLYNGKQVTWVEELYFVQATGPAARSARYLWPWTLVDVRFTSQLTSEVVYFPYVPLNGSAHIQHVLERAKAEYAPSHAWKLGAGYGAYQYGGQPWQNRPFVTTTFSTSVGAFEFWVQKLPGGAQVQVRYQRRLR